MRGSSEQHATSSVESLSWRRRGVLAILFAIAWYVANGYRVGVEDHALLMPLAARDLDPTHLAGDYIFDTTHPTFLWRLFAPVVDGLSVEPAYALLHALCIVGLGLAIIALVRSLAERGAGSLEDGSPRLTETTALALALAVPSISTLAGIPSCDNLLIPRVVSLAPLLYAIALAARGRFFAAFAVSGLVFNLHPTTAAHGAVIVGGLWLRARAPGALRALRGRREAGEPGLLRGVLGGVLELCAFFVAGVPMLLDTVGGGQGFRVPSPYPQHWYEISTVVFPYHHFLDRLPLLTWILGLLPWSVWISARVAGVRSRAVDTMMITVPVFCGLGYLLIEVLRVPQAIALHVFESTRFASYIAPVVMAQWILLAAASPRSRASRAGLIAAALYLTHTLYYKFSGAHTLAGASAPMAILLLGLAGRGLPVATPSPRRARVVVALVAASVLVASVATHRPITPTIAGSILRDYRELEDYMLPPPEGATLAEASGLEVMQWSGAELPASALVVIPPGFIHTLASFRVVGERPIFTCWKDGGEAFFSVDFADTWRERIERLGGEGSTRDFPPGTVPFTTWIHRTHRAVEHYNRLRAREVRAIAQDYGVTHVIRDARAPLELPEIYGDGAFRVYRVD